MATSGRRRSGRLLILLALLLIIILAVVVFVMARTGGLFTPKGTAVPLENVSPTPPQNMVDILVVADQIPRGTKLSQEMMQSGKITYVKYPQSQLFEGLFITNPEDLDKYYAKYDLSRGAPITIGVVSDKPVGSEAAQRVQKGKVAIAIPITRLTSIAYAPQAGDHVGLIVSLLLTDLDANFQTRLPNVVGAVVLPGPQTTGTDQSKTEQNTATVTILPGTSPQGRAELDTTLNQPIYLLPSEPNQRPRLVSQMLISDAEVLWVGNFPEDGNLSKEPTPVPTTAAQGQAETQPAPQPFKPDIITVVVNAQDAVTLNYLLLAGARLNLVLRNPGETDPMTTQAATLQFILDQYKIPNPAKLSYGVEPRIDTLVYPTPQGGE